MIDIIPIDILLVIYLINLSTFNLVLSKKLFITFIKQGANNITNNAICLLEVKLIIDRPIVKNKYLSLVCDKRLNNTYSTKNTIKYT